MWWGGRGAEGRVGEAAEGEEEEDDDDEDDDDKDSEEGYVSQKEANGGRFGQGFWPKQGGRDTTLACKFC